MRRRDIPFLLVLVLLLSAACTLPSFSGQTEEGEPPRTYYETLDLETPESAVDTFVGAFQRDDFLAAYLVLAPQTQLAFQQHVMLLQYKYLFQAEKREDVMDDMIVFSEGIGEGEHIDQGWYLFDQMMLAAKENSALLIDLSGEVAIVETEASETARGDDAVDVAASVEGIEEEVVFRMVQAPSGRWRVHQVRIPGGDEQIIPWSVPTPDD